MCCVVIGWTHLQLWSRTRGAKHSTKWFIGTIKLLLDLSRLGTGPIPDGTERPTDGQTDTTPMLYTTARRASLVTARAAVGWDTVAKTIDSTLHFVRRQSRLACVCVRMYV